MNKIQWSPKMDAVLGTVTDRKAAVLLGLGVSTVIERRHILNISCWYGTKWTPEMDSLLGTVPDMDLAFTFDVSAQTVNNRRHKLDIPAYGPSAPIKWAEAMDFLLGTKSDRSVASELGFRPETVRIRRTQLGIPAFGPNAGVELTLEAESQLGLLTDKDIAAQFGVSTGVVRRRRNQLGIASWPEQNRILPKEVSVYDDEARYYYKARRKHRKLKLLNSLTLEQWKFACEWFEHQCAYCGKETLLTEDHLIPLSKGGPRTASNIIPCCQSCNSQKRAKRAHIWIYEKFGMQRGKKIVDRIVAYLSEVQERWL